MAKSTQLHGYSISMQKWFVNSSNLREITASGYAKTKIFTIIFATLYFKLIIVFVFYKQIVCYEFILSILLSPNFRYISAYLRVFMGSISFYIIYFRHTSIFAL